MPVAHGAFIAIEEGAQHEDLDRFATFSTVVARGEQGWGGRQAGLLFDEGVLIEVETLNPGRVAASGLRQLRYTREFEVNTPILRDEIRDRLPETIRRHFDAALSDEGRVPARTWAATLAALAEIDRELANRLRLLLGALSGGARLHGDAFQVAVQERDALRSALDFAGMKRDALQQVEPTSTRSIIERLGYAVTPEDPAVFHDTLQFLNAKAVGSPSGVVTLTENGTTLTVVNINHRPLETTLGADLIYINETTESLVLVQYKTMRDRLDDKPVFRPSSDANIEKELLRMREINPGDDDRVPANFRLNAQAGYLKLCSPIVAVRQYDTQPTAGMYLPLALWDAILKTPEARGPKGGLAIGYHNVARYLRNTQFAELVRDGWIGTRTASTRNLTELVVEALAGGRSVTAAAASGADPTRIARRAQRQRADIARSSCGGVS
jgi:hypothetical protein